MAAQEAQHASADNIRSCGFEPVITQDEAIELAAMKLLRDVEWSDPDDLVDVIHEVPSGSYYAGDPNGQGRMMTDPLYFGLRG
jgi:trimethylamine:corrinoid methyltransferase-like protein